MGEPGTRDAFDQGPRPLRPTDLERASRSIARAFAWHEPWGAWTLPATETREEILYGLVADDIAGRFLDKGECFTVGGVCVSLWMPPRSEPGGEAFTERRGEGEYALYGERAGALRAGDAMLDELKPEGEHWYLDTIATDPEFRRRGLGGRLLDHDLEHMDQRGRACALDTHTAENVSFYARRGFEVVAEGILPEGGPDVYVMVREPGG